MGFSHKSQFPTVLRNATLQNFAGCVIVPLAIPKMYNIIVLVSQVCLSDEYFFCLSTGNSRKAKQAREREVIHRVLSLLKFFWTVCFQRFYRFRGKNLHTGFPISITRKECYIGIRPGTGRWTEHDFETTIILSFMWRNDYGRGYAQGRALCGAGDLSV